MKYLEGAIWFLIAVLLGAVFLRGTEEGGMTTVMATSLGYKVIVAVMAAAAARFTLKGFDKAIGLDFASLISKTQGASYALPVLQYCGLRFIGVCILFGCIFSS